MMIEEILRWGVPALLLAVGLFYTARILFRRRRGLRSVGFGHRSTRHDRIGQAFAILRALIVIVTVSRVLWSGVDDYLVIIHPLWIEPIMVVGGAMLLGGVAWTIAVSLWMGAAWRSGIDKAAPHGLITTGPFAHTRNPMALGIQASQIGLFLSMPCLFCLFCATVGVIAVHAYIKLEEADLRRRFGGEYDAYCQAVPRWFPRLTPARPPVAPA